MENQIYCKMVINQCNIPADIVLKQIVTHLKRIKKIDEMKKKKTFFMEIS